MSKPQFSQTAAEADCHKAACGKRGNFALTKGDNVSDWALPYKNCDGSINKACVRNALARWNQVQGYSDAQKKAALAKLRRAARSVGISVSDDEFGLPPDPIRERFSFEATSTERHRVEEEGKEPMIIIAGRAISVTTTTNLNTYLAEELQRAAPTLKGVKVYKDHDYSTDNVVGKVVDARFHKEGIDYEAVIQANDPVAEKIELGLIDAVSIGAMVDGADCSICGEAKGTCRHITGEEYNGQTATNIVRGIKFFELSLVSMPGDKRATAGVAQSFDDALLQKVRVAESYMASVEVLEHTAEVEPQMSEQTNVEHEKQLKALETEKAELMGKIKEQAEAMEGLQDKFMNMLSSAKKRIARDILRREPQADAEAEAARLEELMGKDIDVLEAMLDTMVKMAPKPAPSGPTGVVTTSEGQGKRTLTRERKKAVIRRLFKFDDPNQRAISQLDGYNPMAQEWHTPDLLSEDDKVVKE